MRYFGAIWEQGVGMQGQSYAIPTMHGGVDVIKPYVDQFIAYAREHQDKVFYVTRIGCGIAGFKDEEIAPLFQDALDLPNVALPREFVEELLRGYNMFEEDEPIWTVNWYKELIPDMPLTQEQYDIFAEGYYPDWDCRYAPVKVGNYHYIVRSGYWLKKYRYQKQSDGLYHIVESFTSYKAAGENLLLYCMIDGYYRTRLFEESVARDYWRERRENCVVVVDEKPKRCMHCDFTEFKEVIYGEPCEQVDEDKFVLGGCCVNEYSHNWVCAQCQVKYRDESLW